MRGDRLLSRPEVGGSRAVPGPAAHYALPPMPTYEYRCENGHTFEVFQRMSDDPIEVCEVCGAPVERVFHPVAVHFKGSGFYSTDYGAKAKSSSGKDGDSSSSGDSDGSGSESSGSESSTKKSDSSSTDKAKTSSSSD
jgi:putative FmdB family regulatory protein